MNLKIKLKNYKFKINFFKKFFLFFSLIFLTLYIPLSFTIYSNSFYTFNYENQNTYKLISKDLAINSTNNLINFFIHKQELDNKIWNIKEIIHMSDVRKIYDFLFFIFLFSLVFLIIFWNKKLIQKNSKINLFLISSLILLIPIFNFFWNKIFHLIFFNNNLWIITPQDISYYLFEISFFINALIFIILISLFLNLILFLFLRYK